MSAIEGDLSSEGGGFTFPFYGMSNRNQVVQECILNLDEIRKTEVKSIVADLFAAFLIFVFVFVLFTFLLFFVFFVLFVL